MIRVAQVAIAILLIFGVVIFVGSLTDPSPGTLAWHKETLERTHNAVEICGSEYKGKEFEGCVRGKAGSWIARDHYMGQGEEEIGRMVIANCSSNLSIDIPVETGRDVLLGYGSKKAEGWMDCIENTTSPPKPKSDEGEDDQFEQFKKAMEDISGQVDSNLQGERGHKAIETCSRNLGINVPVENGRDVLIGGYGLKKAEDWMDCVANTTWPVKPRP